jgi:hypothetical protein
MIVTAIVITARTRPAAAMIATAAIMVMPLGLRCSDRHESGDKQCGRHRACAAESELRTH